MQDITLVAGGATDADNGEGGGTDNCDGGTADNGDGGTAENGDGGTADNGDGGTAENGDGGTADNGDGGAADTKHHHVARKQLQENDWLKWEDGPEGGLFCTICQKHAKHIEINPKVMGAMVTRGCRNGRKFAEIVLSHSRSDWHQKSMKLEGETFLENWMRGENAASEEEKASKFLIWRYKGRGSKILFCGLWKKIPACHNRFLGPPTFFFGWAKIRILL